MGADVGGGVAGGVAGSALKAATVAKAPAFKNSALLLLLFPISLPLYL